MAQVEVLPTMMPSIVKRILVLSLRRLEWFSSLQEISEQFIILDYDERLMMALLDTEYDLVFIDSAAVTTDIFALIKDLKSRFHSMTLAIIDDTSLEFHSQIFAAGADDIFEPDIEIESFLPRLRLLLRQTAKSKLAENQTQVMHAASILAQQFHNSKNLNELIVDAIDSVCKSFDLSGMSILIMEDEELQLYTGTSSIENQAQISAASAKLHDYNPLVQVMESGMSLISQDIRKHRYYSPLPIIEDPKAAIIVPLRFGNQLFGSIGIYSRGEDLANEYLVSFELLATHFASAYVNIRKSSNREVDVNSMRRVLRAYQSLANLYSIEEIARVLHELLMDIKGIEDVVVWLFKPRDESQDIVAHANDNRLSKLVSVMFQKGDLDLLMAELDISMKPLVFGKDHKHQKILADLRKRMDTNTVLMFPVASNIIMGGIFIKLDSNHRLATNERNLLDSFVHATVQAIERNTIIRSLQEQHGRLDALLRSIREGIFFVNEGGRVIFCNPQFTELSGITPSQIVDNNYLQLFRAISQATPNPSDTLAQLNTAFSQITAQEALEEYPIIEIHHIEQELDLYIELSRIDGADDYKGWIGFIRSQEQRVAGVRDQQSADLMQGFMQDLLLQMMNLQSTIRLLPEQYDVFDSQHYLSALNSVEHQVGNTIHTWKNYTLLHNLLMSEAEPRLALYSPVKFLEAFVATRPANENRGKITVVSNPPYMDVMLDERQMRQVLINIVNFFSQSQQAEAPITVTIATEAPNVLIAFQMKNAPLSEDALELVFNPFAESDKSELRSTRMAMYISKQIVEAHNGTIELIQRRGWGLMLRMTLPIANLEGIQIEETAVSVTPMGSTMRGLTIVTIESAEALLAELIDTLDDNGHEILPEDNVQNALTTLKLAHVDLVIVEADNSTNILSIVQSIRQKTEIPILIVAVPGKESDALRALSNGSADVYLLAPVAPNHLLAQLRSIVKRKDIATNMAEPIQIGELHLDFSRRKVYLGNQLLDLTAKEYELLRMLVTNRDQVLSHQQLITQIWGPEYRDEKHYLWVNMSRLRRKLERNKTDQRYIYTQQGIGYIFRSN
jgi:two-component system, OmpR family, KDP operon response regulator KdpE